MNTPNRSELGLQEGLALHIDAAASFYIQETVRKGMGKLSQHGALVIQTGKHTGRCAEDRYIVRDATTENTIWWENNLRAMTPEQFTKLQTKVLEYLNAQTELYITNRSVGAHTRYNIGATLVTTHPQHALFSQHLFREQEHEYQKEKDFRIYHAPELKLNPEEFGLRAPTVIVTNFTTNTTIIVGTLYAGEIKKSMFSVLNYRLPEQGVLPMHAGASALSGQETSVFFGLSGTGKTTLSTDVGTSLIGDDEHGLSDEGIFNFEGGCYAKTYKLALETEPDIFKAANRFGALLENVTIKETQGEMDFFDKSLTENGRASYPLHFIDGFIPSGKSGIPNHIFFLSADAFGVLPPVAKLDLTQAMYYFTLGYTAKLAGTEVGVVEPKPAFSPCFGAPFMLRRPEVYASLLGQYLKKHNINVWLINTGWARGPFGIGERFPLKVTRQIIRQIQAGKVDQTPTEIDPIFNLKIPVGIEGVENELLWPQKCWKDPSQYVTRAKELAQSFENQMKKFSIPEVK